jgi:hypothetical protein
MLYHSLHIFAYLLNIAFLDSGLGECSFRSHIYLVVLHQHAMRHELVEYILYTPCKDNMDYVNQVDVS